jgi:asparagine synthase (glutamine-hydrolysing)
MAKSLSHRGPDAAGFWSDAGVALVHRRLSVVELSPAGAQPMHSVDERFVVTFNGEIYNFREIREELRAKGRRFRGNSDTEVLLESVAEWGLVAAVRRFVGMFAFALFDRAERKVHLVRDRFGEKPLYYGWANGVFLFGSELKALRAHPAWNASIDRDALAMYFRQGSVPAPFSIYRGIFKLPPGCTLKMEVEGLVPPHLPAPESYWSAREVVEQGLRHPFAGTDAEALARLEDLLGQAVAGQMMADVPVGAFLSGGVDSSAVVAAMQRQSSRPVRTFTIGFTEKEYNEAVYARAVADHLGTQHTELYVTPEDARAVIPKLPRIYDEPFSDSSQIPTYLVAALARQQVTVSLSGDGGDELFGGYRRYQDTLKLSQQIGRLPPPIRRPLSQAILAVSPGTWERGAGWLASRILGVEWRGRTGDRLHKAAHLLEHSDIATLYLRYVCRDPRLVPQVIGGTAAQLPLAAAARVGLNPSPPALALMTYLDLIGYLPDDILVKVDRASMAVSLESRIPLLDHRLVAFATSLPTKFKLRAGQNKWLLRQLLERDVPKSLIDRPKMGFGVPIEYWLRGPLKDWADSLLAEDRLQREGYIDPKRVRQMWGEHLGGLRRWHYPLWDILMFQAWLETERG